MQTIVFDLEFNRDVSSLTFSIEKVPANFLEIIQIGALKLDSNLDLLASFSRYVKPVVYAEINSFITDLTGITAEQLLQEDDFCNVYRDFIEFIGSKESVFCIWGGSDIKELFRNAEVHCLNQKLLPRQVINLQPYVSEHFGLGPKKLLRLENAVELLNISKEYDFHHALHDAYYTAELFKQIRNPKIRPKIYDPSKSAVRLRQRKSEIDFEALIRQLEKMVARTLTVEELGLIKLAYQMGRTHQFLK